MQIGTLMRVGVTLLAGIVPLVLGQYPVVNLYHYDCKIDKDCGAVSRSCWAPAHPWGGTNCQHCSGTSTADYCEKSHEKYCLTAESQDCGYIISGGTCVGAGNLGTCSGGFQTDIPCHVPKCIPRLVEGPEPGGG
jgi:hypothetical protein